MSKRLSKVSDGETFSKNCCKEGIEITGPLWTGGINDSQFVEECIANLKTRKNTESDQLVVSDIEFGEGKLIHGILSSIKKEEIVGSEFNYVWQLDKYSSALKTTSIPRKLVL